VEQGSNNSGGQAPALEGHGSLALSLISCSFTCILLAPILTLVVLDPDDGPWRTAIKHQSLKLDLVVISIPLCISETAQLFYAQPPIGKALAYFFCLKHFAKLL